jgi:large subunit ribosomal protein L14
MIIKNSILVPTDKNGVWLVRVFHLYGGFFKKYASSGSFIKVSIRKTKLNSLVLKKNKMKSIIILTKKLIKKNDFSFFRFKLNSAVLLKRRLTPVGKELFGPSIFSLKRKKFLYSFSGVL